MTKIRIQDAKTLARRDKSQAVMILQVAKDGGVTIVTYGENERKCAVIGEWAQGLFEFAVTAIPFRTVFGYGYKGEPTPLTIEEYEQLPPEGRAFADRHDGRPIGSVL